VTGPQAETARAELVEAARAVLAGTPQAGQESIHPQWQRHLQAIATSVLHDDVETFTRWPVMAQTMFVGDYEDTARQFAALTALPDWERRWKPALVESPVGGPTPSRIHPPSSGNLIRQAYTLARFEAEARAPIDAFEQIVEFGGGFGALCRLALRLGFKGRYVIVENQPVRALLRWYLLCSGIAPAPDGALPERGVCTVPGTALADIFADVLPDGEARRTAFLANWSLSETRPEVRDAVFHTLRRAQVDAIWVVYQQHFGVHNGAVFTTAIKNFLNVYEASIRPFQPDAPDDDYAYGHACLALNRVPGRRFPAAIRNLPAAPFETSTMRHLTREEAYAHIRKAIADRAPFSLIRLGDGEGRIMGFPHFVERARVADIWENWFGHRNAADEQVTWMQQALKDVCRNADLLGIPKAEASIACEFGRVAALLPRDGYVERTALLCHAGIHLGLHRADLYRPLFDGLPRIGIIGPRDLTATLPALYGVPEVEWLPVPPEMTFSGLPEGEKAGLVRADAHLAQRFPALMEREIPALLARHPGLVVLVGAGILGKLYCRRVKDLGGVAVDVGSMMDVWAGLKTRDNQDFDNLRPIRDEDRARRLP